jgi:hypothetical protein
MEVVSGCHEAPCRCPIKAIQGRLRCEEVDVPGDERFFLDPPEEGQTSGLGSVTPEVILDFFEQRSLELYSSIIHFRKMPVLRGTAGGVVDSIFSEFKFLVLFDPFQEVNVAPGEDRGKPRDRERLRGTKAILSHFSRAGRGSRGYISLKLAECGVSLCDCPLDEARMSFLSGPVDGPRVQSVSVSWRSQDTA